MNFVEPIRNMEKVIKMYKMLLESNPRNFLLFYIGVNTLLRISDLLELKITDFKNKEVLSIIEKKTKKKREFKIDGDLKKITNEYIKKHPDDIYLFQSRKKNKLPMTKEYFQTILNESLDELEMNKIEINDIRNYVAINEIDNIYEELKNEKVIYYLLLKTIIETDIAIEKIFSMKVKDINMININNNNLKKILIEYSKDINEGNFIFKERKGLYKPISRQQAYRIINKAAKEARVKGRIGCHTTRKTGAYHLYYQNDKDIALVQRILGHSDPKITLRYIGITQDIIDLSLENSPLRNLPKNFMIK